MNDKRSAQSTSGKFPSPGVIITEGSALLSEADALLNELLPQNEDTGTLIPGRSGSIAYKDIRRIRLSNGIPTVRLPGGTMLARSLDRKSGHVFWVKVRA